MFRHHVGGVEKATLIPVSIRVLLRSPATSRTNRASTCAQKPWRRSRPCQPPLAPMASTCRWYPPCGPGRTNGASGMASGTVRASWGSPVRRAHRKSCATVRCQGIVAPPLGNRCGFECLGKRTFRKWPRSCGIRVASRRMLTNYGFMQVYGDMRNGRTGYQEREMALVAPGRWLRGISAVTSTCVPKKRLRVFEGTSLQRRLLCASSIGTCRGSMALSRAPGTRLIRFDQPCRLRTRDGQPCDCC